MGHGRPSLLDLKKNSVFMNVFGNLFFLEKIVLLKSSD
jgi:hypothetical protein